MMELETYLTLYKMLSIKIKNLIDLILLHLNLANAGREFENSNLWVIQEGNVPLDSSVNLTFGNKLDTSNFSDIFNDLITFQLGL